MKLDIVFFNRRFDKIYVGQWHNSKNMSDTFSYREHL